jgi:hypothetical protein
MGFGSRSSELGSGFGGPPKPTGQGPVLPMGIVFRGVAKALVRGCQSDLLIYDWPGPCFGRSLRLTKRKDGTDRSALVRLELVWVY